MKKLYAKIFAMLALAFSLTNLAFGQEIEITGKVTDAKDGSGLPGVNVLVVGTPNGAISDINGSYKLKAGIGAILEFRFLGFTTERRTVVASAVIDVSLSEEVKNLKEAVVIGYGQVRKKDLTGSLSSVTSKDFQTGINTTPEALIAGKVAGVQITSNGGAPGSGSTIRIRGGASLTASSDPLIIIDGVPVENGGVNGYNVLSLINPNDIENFTVLKDASATAIYGSRASNGVIIITTKKGSVSQLRPTITLSTQNSISQPYRFVDVLSGDEFRSLVKQYGTPAQKKLVDTAGTTNTDWQKEIYRLAYTTDNNLSFTGNLKFKEGYNLPYRISGGYLSQQGILKRDQMDRFSGGLNLSPVLLDGDLKVNFNFKIARSTNFFANRGAIGNAVVFDPTKPVNATDSVGKTQLGGYFEWTDNTGKTPLSLAPKNPVGLLNSREDKSEVNRILTNIQLDYAIPFLKDLRANLNIGTDRSEGKGTVKVDSIYASDFVRKGVNNHYLQKKQNNLLEFYFNYNKEIKEISSRFDVVAGYGYQDFLTTVYNYADFRYNGDTMPTTKPVFPIDKPQNRLISYYGRLNYVLMEKFLVTGTVRTDGSSRFANAQRWGFFPSVAAAYTLSEESFIKKIPAINLLKVRVGYGLTGQQDIGSNYSYLPTYRLTNPSAQYQFGDQYYYGYRPSAYDPKIKWEQTATTNAAVDFSLFSDRFSGSVDFYLKQTSNLLNTIPAPAGTNFSDQILTNVGSIENRGVEININTVPVKTQDFTWNFGFNVTFNQNKVTKLTTAADSNFLGVTTGGIDGGVGSTAQIHSVGYPTYSFLVYRQVYQNGKPVEGQFEDLNGDGRINEKDQYRYKQAAPTCFYGINTSVNYKKLTVGMVLRGSFGNYVYNNIYSDKGNRNAAFLQTGYVNNISGNYLETGFTGKPVGGASTDQMRLSDYYVQNASFIRFDNLFVSYNFGEITKKFSLAANFNVQNAFFISNYKGIDPEIGNGIDNNFYPRPRVFTLGLTANFMP